MSEPSSPAPPLPDPADVAVVGAGPVGLHAALKAALLFHTALVFDKGKKHSRIFFAPRVDNIPGFPEGVSGAELLRRQREHVARTEAAQGRRRVELVEPAEVVRLTRAAPDGPFELTARLLKTGAALVRHARVVVLATGMVDRQPFIGEPGGRDIRAILPYANRGTVDYCLLCDGHTVAGKRVAVIGADRKAVGIARELRDHFGAAATVVACLPCAGAEEGGAALEEIRARAAKAGLPLLVKEVRALYGLKDDKLGLRFADGSEAEFDKGFLSFGWFKKNTELAEQMGALLDADGYVRTSADCEVLGPGGTAIPGLYAVGDVRAESWNQIPTGWGDAETAIIHAYSSRLPPAA